MNDPERSMYDFARSIVRSAGVKLKLERRHTGVTAREKTSHADLVTVQDVLIENFIKKSINERFSSHRILAEESSTEFEDYDGYRWILDPIDGTINYYRFGRDYSISLALYKGHEPIFGLIFDVENNIMFSAIQGQGAITNGPILDRKQDSKDVLQKAIVCMSIRTMRELTGQGMDVIGMLSGFQAYRYIGCASLELCKVGDGEYDLFISSNVYEWDIAAARIYLEQRGGNLIVKRKDSSNKLFVAAYRSSKIWEKAVQYLPDNYKLI